MVLEGCVEKLHDELEYNRSLLKHIGRNVIFEPAGNERGALIIYDGFHIMFHTFWVMSRISERSTV